MWVEVTICQALLKHNEYMDWHKHDQMMSDAMHARLYVQAQRCHPTTTPHQPSLPTTALHLLICLIVGHGFPLKRKSFSKNMEKSVVKSDFGVDVK
jgi:hypothetical protein